MSFLFSSAHLLPALNQECLATRRLLDLLKSIFLGVPAGSLSSVPPSSPPSSLSLLLPSADRSLQGEVAAGVSVDAPSSPFLGMPASETANEEQSVEESVRLPDGSIVKVPFNVFVDALTALVGCRWSLPHLLILSFVSICISPSSFLNVAHTAVSAPLAHKSSHSKYVGSRARLHCFAEVSFFLLPAVRS